MRTHYCGEIGESLAGRTIEAAGWVHRRRDHGGVIFVDLRDRSGLLQVVFDPDSAEAFKVAEHLGREFCIQVQGKVRPRPAGTANPNLPSGQIEVLAQKLVVLNPSATPPFALDEEVGEELRLKHRYIDLRRDVMQERIRRRHAITRAMREYLDGHDFVDIETPMLTKATPEGARDYLVPSRTHPGKFFALPQSPQIFKQLLMMSGFDRYYQIVRCFRDEDLRADRQPEFTQLDIETSFLEQDQVMALMEGLVRHIFSRVLKVQLPNPFPRLTYAEAMRRFGSDKPDLRVALEFTDVADLVRGSEFKVFAGPAADPDGRVAALAVPRGGELSRKQIDDYTAYVARYGARGLAYIKVNDPAKGRDGLQSPILKFLSDAAVADILERTKAGAGDLVFFGADKAKVVNDALGALRLQLGRDLGLVEEGWQPLWVVDFPMFEWDADSKRWMAMHHPFTSPANPDADALKANPKDATARAYDMVLNGSEIGGGSIRIHRVDMQSAVFDLLGISREQATLKFGFLLEALRYGAPPHGGIAFGLDRFAMLMSGADSIRDVIAFPKTQSAWDPLTDAPSEADDAALAELHIRVKKPLDGAGSSFRSFEPGRKLRNYDPAPRGGHRRPRPVDERAGVLPAARPARAVRFQGLVISLPVAARESRRGDRRARRAPARIQGAGASRRAQPGWRGRDRDAGARVGAAARTGRAARLTGAGFARGALDCRVVVRAATSRLARILRAGARTEAALGAAT